jgi:hypothetical protein
VRKKRSDEEKRREPKGIKSDFEGEERRKEEKWVKEQQPLTPKTRQTHQQQATSQSRSCRNNLCTAFDLI